MDVAHESDIVVVVVCAGDIVRRVVIICANVDNHQIRWALSRKVPFGWILAVDLVCPPGCVRGAVPLVGLMVSLEDDNGGPGLPDRGDYPSNSGRGGRYRDRP